MEWPRLRGIVRGAALLLVGLAAFVALIKTLSERPDDCVCADGTEQGGWSTGWTTPEAHCASLCRSRGGGRPFTAQETEAKQLLLRARFDGGVLREAR